jgi:hypothetical protein
MASKTFESVHPCLLCFISGKDNQMNKNNHDPWTDLAMTQAAMEYYRILDENEQLAQRIAVLEHG